MNRLMLTAVAALCGLSAAGGFASEPAPVTIVVATKLSRPLAARPVHHKHPHRHIVHAHKVPRPSPAIPAAL
ncbi:hypothetical protein ACFOLG_14325 [Vogesella facilis]|uniref:Uncharacterized protein n=1 Tax=Vogesella facilis TaxID=1655232 RepID=A0ABV7RJ23_9NEIS